MEARQKFEALPEFREGLMHCHYNKSINDYCSNVAHDTEWEWNTQFVSGGWCAFQEQEKKIGVIQHLRNNQYESLMNVKDKCDELTKSLKDCFHNIDSQDKEIIQDYINEIGSF